MLRLTNGSAQEDGMPLFIAGRHVVSVRPVVNGGAFAEILTVTGVVYRVKETVDQITKQPAWADID